MDVSLNDIIKIIRSSPTAKKSFYYRRVVKWKGIY
jgi:DNA-directed RNA polymerase subunit H (RpoH/RPB5)